MTKLRRINGMLFILILILVLVLGAACGGTQPSEGETEEPGGETGGTPPAEEKQTVTVALYANAISLDPQDTNDNLSISIERAIYEGLVGFDADFNLIPKLATEWETAPDATSLTFTLREGVTFQDGSPFNAEAVKKNFDRVRDPNTTLKRHSLFAMIEEIEILDDYQVRFVLSEPFGAMLYNFAHPSAMVISPKAIDEGDPAKQPVGTGPYAFVEWEPGDHVTMEKHADYWGGEPAVDEIIFKPVPEAGTRISMLKAGEADFIYPLPPVQVPNVEGADGVSVIEKPSIYVRYVAMNCQKEPFTNPVVRQALNYAVDKEALLSVVAQGRGYASDSPVARQTIFYHEVGAYEYDLEHAKTLLAEAGHPDGFETTMWTGNTTEDQELATALQQQLAKVGVKVNIQPFESGTLSDKRFQPVEQNESQLNLTGWSPSTGEADWALRPHFSKTLWPPAGYNIAFFYEPDVEERIIGALQTGDQAEREQLYAEVQELVMEDAPWIFLYVQNNIAGINDNYTGMYPLADNSVDFSHVQPK